MPSLSLFINRDARPTEVRQRSRRLKEILFATELVPPPRGGGAGARATAGRHSRLST
jgi:hypothetical protein